MTCRG